MTTLTSGFFQIINGNSGNSVVDNEVSEDMQNKHINLTSAITVSSDVMDEVLLKILEQLGKKEIDDEVITELEKMTREIDKETDINRYNIG